MGQLRREQSDRGSHMVWNNSDEIAEVKGGWKRSKFRGGLPRCIFDGSYSSIALAT